MKFEHLSNKNYISYAKSVTQKQFQSLPDSEAAFLASCQREKDYLSFRIS